MVAESFIEAVRNVKTGALFILLDDAAVGRFRVISPNGQIMVLPEDFFEEDPVLVQADQFNEHFTQVQLNSLERHDNSLAAQAERASIGQTMHESSADKTPRSPRKKREKPDLRTGVKERWSSSNLTFYRHRIEPLGPRQSFVIDVENVGQFKLTRAEFDLKFNDVVMSPSYRQEGIYIFRQFPADRLESFRV